MLLMVEKGIKGGICCTIHQHVKTNNKYMQIMIKIKNSYIFILGTVKLIWMDNV